jgi:hypothetical protein
MGVMGADVSVIESKDFLTRQFRTLFFISREIFNKIVLKVSIFSVCLP